MIAYLEDRLVAEPEAVPRARHALAVQLLPIVSELALDKILLLATEAVTSALRTTTTPWRLRADADERLVRVSVEYLPDAVPPPETSAEGEDGLRDELFEALSVGWGFDGDGFSLQTIWFEVPST